MRLNILADVHWESRVDRVLNELSEHGFRDRFAMLEYGSGLAGLTIVLMCRDPSLKFARRIKFSRAEKKLYMDIMLDFASLKAASSEERKRIVAQRLLNEVPSVLTDARVANFDADRFISDFQIFIASTGWL